MAGGPRFRAKTGNAKTALKRAREAAKGIVLDQALEEVAWRMRTGLVAMTPRGFTGQTRRAWHVLKISKGYAVRNPSKVMRFLDAGTGGAKGNPFLFIPLNAAAAVGGWKPGMKYGKDYVLARRVKGIKGLHIVKKETDRAKRYMRSIMEKYRRRVVKAAKG